MSGSPSAIRRDSFRRKNDRATFTLIAGCMFSGKTTELLDRVERRAGLPVQVFKHRIDDRYGTEAVVTHTGRSVAATAVADAADLAAGLLPATRMVAIDEAHFFDESLAEVIQHMTSRGIDVIATSLDLTSWGRPFGVLQRLRAISDDYLVRYAVCARCGEQADHTQRLTPIVGEKLVGGPEAYEPRCASCWRQPPEPPPRGE